MSYTRRAEMTWTEAELKQYGDKILLKDEALYVKNADGKRTVRFGDGVTAVKNLPVSIDYGAVKAEADRAKAQADRAADQVTKAQEQVSKAQEQAGKAAVSAEQAAQAADFWTPVESVRQLGHSEEHTGKTLDMKNTIAGPAASLKLLGDTRVIKPGYTGKNLLPNTRSPGYTQTVNGVKFVVNADKSITAVGTATANALFYLADNNEVQGMILPAGVYMASDRAEGTDTTYNIRIRTLYDGEERYLHSNTNWFPTQQVKFLEAPYIVVLAGKTINATFYPQLEEGRNQTAYEPWCGGAPAPNPDCPQQIVNAGGMCDWDGVLEQGTFSATGVKSDSTERVRTADFARVQGGQTYQITATGAVQVFLCEYDAKGNFLAVTDYTALPRTFTTQLKTNKIMFALRKGSSGTLTPSEVTVSICPVLRYLKTSGNMLRNGYGNSNVEYNGGNEWVYLGDGYSRIVNKAAGNQGIYLYGPDKTKQYIQPNKEYYVVAEVKENTLSRTFEFNMAGDHTSTYTPFPVIEVPEKWTGKKIVKVKSPATFKTTSMLYSRCPIGGNDGEYIIARVMMFSCEVTENMQYQVGEIDFVDIPLMNEAGNALPPLAEIRDESVKNRIINDNGIYKLVQEVGTYTFRSCETFVIDDILIGYPQSNLNPRPKPRSNILCTHSIGNGGQVNNYQPNHSGIGFSDINFRYFDTKVTQEEARTVMQGQTIYYAVKDPQAITLHADAQAALNKLASTYTGRTIITSADPLPPTLQMTVGVQADKVTYSRPESDTRYSNAFVREAEGDLIKIHTATSPAIEMKLSGKTEQDTTTGKNLLPYPYEYETCIRYGINFTLNTDGSLKLSGTATEDVFFRFAYTTPLELQPGTYTLSGLYSGFPGSGSTFLGANKSTESGYIAQTQTEAGATFMLTETTSIRAVVRIGKGVSVSGVIYPQIEKGSTATAYEPYTGGLSSPDPEYPQPIRSVGGEVEWNGIIEQGAVGSSAQEIDMTTRVRTGYIKINGGCTYRVDGNGANFVSFVFYDRHKQFISTPFITGDIAGRIPCAYTVPPNAGFVRINFAKANLNSGIIPADVTGVTICSVINAWAGYGENLIRSTASFPLTSNGVTMDYDSETGIFSLNGTATSTGGVYFLWEGPICNLKVGDKFTIAAKRVTGSAYMGFGIVAGSNVTQVILGNGDNEKIIHATIKYEEPFKYIRFAVTNGVNYTGNKVKVEISYGHNTPKYEPPRPSIKYEGISIPLMDTHGDALEPLRAVEVNRYFDYNSVRTGFDGTPHYWICDHLKKIDGAWKICRRICKLKITGDEDWKYNSSASTDLTAYATKLMDDDIKPIDMTLFGRTLNSYGDKLTCMYTYSGHGDKEGWYFGATFNIRLLQTRLKTRDTAGFKAALSEIRPTLYYPYANPPEPITLCDEAQTALNKLAQMYPNQTVITGVDAVAPEFRVKYAADVNYEFDRLSNAISALGGKL